MRIAIDIQGIQSEGSRTRGIGRYAIEIVRNLIKYFPDDDYVLVANGALKDVRNILIPRIKSQLSDQNAALFGTEKYCIFLKEGFLKDKML